MDTKKFNNEEEESLREYIKNIYKIFGFECTEAKNYEDVECELFKDIHLNYIQRCLNKLAGGMVGVDSG